MGFRTLIWAASCAWCAWEGRLWTSAFPAPECPPPWPTEVAAAPCRDREERARWFCEALGGHRRQRTGYEGADDPWCYSGMCAGAGKAGVRECRRRRAAGFLAAGQRVWGFTLRIATLWNILRDDSHTFMTWLSPSVFCQKTLNRHEGLFPGIWGSEEGRSGKAVSRSATSLGGTLRCHCMGHSCRKDGAGGSPCFMSVGCGEPGLGMKRRPVSLSRTDRQTHSPPPWGFSDAVHQGALFSGKPQCLCAKWTVHSEPNCEGWGLAGVRGCWRHMQAVLHRGSMEGPEGAPRLPHFFPTSPHPCRHQGREQLHPTVCPAFRRLRVQLGLWVRHRQAGPSPASAHQPHPQVRPAALTAPGPSLLGPLGSQELLEGKPDPSQAWGCPAQGCRRAPG